MKRLLIGLILILAFPVILWAIPPGGSGSGDMTKAVYDTNADNVVDSAASTTGNAATATALAANGANCSAGYAPLGVDASGAVEGCWQVTPAAIGAESASSNDIDPDRLNGDTTDDNKVDQDILEGFGPSATPSIVMQDSDNAPGTASIYGNSSGGANDIIMTLGVEDSSGGESTAYIELDGVSESVDVKKTLVVEAAQIANGGITVADSQVITFDESAADPNDADIQLSGTDGVLKIAAANGAYNEDLTIDLDTTENTATVGSSTGVTSISLGALNMATTGTILGAINVVVTTDGALSPTAAQMYGTMFIADNATATNDTDYTLPGAVAGMSACFYDNGAGTGGIIIDAAAGDEILLDGTGVGAADAIDSPGVAGDGANGDFICLMAIDATNWITLGRSGTWVDGGAD